MPQIREKVRNLDWPIYPSKDMIVCYILFHRRPNSVKRYYLRRRCQICSPLLHLTSSDWHYPISLYSQACLEVTSQLLNIHIAWRILNCGIVLRPVLHRNIWQVWAVTVTLDRVYRQVLTLCQHIFFRWSGKIGDKLLTEELGSGVPSLGSGSHTAVSCARWLLQAIIVC